MQPLTAADDPERRTVLIVEDDDSTARALAYHLSKAGFATSVSKDGLAAITTLKAWRPDALVLDLMLPHVDGLSIIQDVRRWAPDLPIIVMTARPDEAQRLEALRLGADDLLRKPFSAKEMVVRIDSEIADLTPLETKLLWILADEAGRTLTREEIFERVWGGARPDGDRSVDVLVRRLRAKVDEGGGGYTYVQTELRRGYRLQAVPRAFPLHGRRRR